MTDPFWSPAAVQLYLCVRFKCFIDCVLFFNQNIRQLIETL